MSETILSGRAACYRNYRCGDGLWMSVGCLEPKFWVTFVELLGRPELAPAGFDTTDDGKAVAGEVSRLLAAHPRAHWMALFEPHALPIAPVHALADAIDDPVLAQSSLLEQLPLPDGTTIAVPGPAMTSIGQTPAAPAPSLGEHTESVLRELGE